MIRIQDGNLQFYLPRIPKVALYPILTLIISVPFIVGVSLFEMGWLIPYQVIAVVSILVIQLWAMKRSWHKCINCGHERYMHDKIEMMRKNTHSLLPVICDDFQHDFRGITNPNYQNKYWNGRDPRNDIGGI